MKNLSLFLSLLMLSWTTLSLAQQPPLVPDYQVIYCGGNDQNSYTPKLSDRAAVWVKVTGQHPAVKEQIVAYDLKTKSVVNLTAPTKFLALWALSGSRCFWSQPNGTIAGSTIWQYDFETGLSKSIATTTNYLAGVSVDGDRLLWSENTANGLVNLNIIDLTTGQNQPIKQNILSSQPNLSYPWVVYSANPDRLENDEDIFLLNLTTDQVTRITNTSELETAFSTDGRWVTWVNFYDSSVSLYNIDDETSQTFQEVYYPGIEPILNQDRLIYEDKHGTIHIINLTTNASQLISSAVSGLGWCRLGRIDVCGDMMVSEISHLPDGEQFSHNDICLINLKPTPSGWFIH
ncbi:MAG: hypothetical protein JW816_00145 [Candidatus Buchananbacteria bacterium]|nr:hypothetical protein [Candidatus Buchananbacteria bacterium]